MEICEKDHSDPEAGWFDHFELELFSAPAHLLFSPKFPARASASSLRGTRIGRRIHKLGSQDSSAENASIWYKNLRTMILTNRIVFFILVVV